MKKAILIIISLLILSNVAWAQKAPDGFLDLKWGSTREEAIRMFGIDTDTKNQKERDAQDAEMERLSEKTDRILQDLQIQVNVKRPPKVKESPKMDRTGGSLYYSDPQGKLEKIGSVYVLSYHFWFSPSDKFYKASAEFYSGSDFDIMLKALTMKYGKPAKTPLVLAINPNAEVGMTYTWRPENKVEITLKRLDAGQPGCRGYIGCGFLYYTYLPIWNEIHRVKEEDVTKTKDKL